MIITPGVIAGVEREAGVPVYVSHYSWPLGPVVENEGLNVLRHGEGAWWTDEVPLEPLANRDIPAGANGHVVLSCDPVGFAVIDPNGQLLGVRAGMPDVLALIGVGG